MSGTSNSAVPLEEPFHFQTEPAIVRDTLKGIEAAFKGGVGELTNNGIMVFLNKLVKPKLQSLLAEAFRDVEYLISLEGGGNTYSHSGPDDEDKQEGISPKSRDDLVTLRFQAGWGVLMAPLPPRDFLTFFFF